MKPLGSKKYCNRLESIFHLTAPTYYDLEVLRNGEHIEMGVLGLDEEEQKIHNLASSRFGAMEQLLQAKVPETVDE